MNRDRSGGYSNWGLLAVGLVVACCAVFIVALVMRARNDAMRELCKSRAMDVAIAAIRYRAQWNGWFYPSEAGYVRMAGRKLSGDPGYEPAAAARCTDFVCPAEARPSIDQHGYPSSYRLPEALWMPRWHGLISSEKRFLLLYEKGKRHKDPKTGQRAAIYVFNDLVAQWSIKEAELPRGLRCRLWKASPFNWDLAKQNAITAPPIYDGAWLGELRFDYGRALELARKGAEPGGGAGHEPKDIIFRLDGFCLISGGARFTLSFEASGRGFLWLDINGDEVPSPKEFVGTDGAKQRVDLPLDAPKTPAKAFRKIVLLLQPRDEKSDFVFRLSQKRSSGRRYLLPGYSFFYRPN